MVVDLKNGKVVYLSRERWKHIVHEHPAVGHSLFRIEETLCNPLEVKLDEGDSKLVLYYRYYKHAPGQEKYLLVIVKYLNGEGFIVTSFYMKRRNDE